MQQLLIELQNKSDKNDVDIVLENRENEVVLTFTLVSGSDIPSMWSSKGVSIIHKQKR